jgi:SAM-dependent methyltransferase
MSPLRRWARQLAGAGQGAQDDNVDLVPVHPAISSPDDVRAIRQSRRHPRITQADYLHLQALTHAIEHAVSGAPAPIKDVLDVWCGSRPYDYLFPAGTRCVGLDVVGNPYGVADVVSDEFLPFPDESFDLVTCIQSFHYMPDPTRAVSELRRVLRTGGTVIVSSVFGFDYDRRHFEARYTEHQLRELYLEWDDVRVSEDGARATTWAVLTGSLLAGLEQRVASRRAHTILHPAFVASYALVNVVGMALAGVEGRAPRAAAFPTNLTLIARKPLGA